MNQQVRFAKRDPALDRILTLELVRVTERAAIAAARLRGRGDEKAADQAAVDAMRTRAEPARRSTARSSSARASATRRRCSISARRSAPGKGPKVDIALDPLEGTTICAKNLPNSLAVIAIAEQGSLLNAPDVYMEKIAIGPGYPAGHRRPRRVAGARTSDALAKAKGVPVSEITACILDRPRHAQLIEELRATGAAIRLIGDGDVAGIIHTTEPGRDRHRHLSRHRRRAGGRARRGGAPLHRRPDAGPAGHRYGREARARDAHGHHRPRTASYDMSEMARGDVLFAATGVTDGNLLAGVQFGRDCDHHPYHRHALVLRHGALDQGRAPGPGEVRRRDLTGSRMAVTPSHRRAPRRG